jgi:hypothetical protein
MELRPDIGHHAALCQELDSPAWRRGEPFRCVCGQTLREKEALMSEEDKQRLARMRAVSREFFADKPVGTTIEQHDLDAYRQRLQDAARAKDTA